MNSHRTSLALALAILAGGCSGSSGDPADSALRPGQAVVAGNGGALWLDTDVSLPMLAQGARLVVVHDPGEAIQDEISFARQVRRAGGTPKADEIRRRGPSRYRPGDSIPGMATPAGSRMVVVAVDGGPQDGTVGTVFRHDVRPVP